MSTYKESDFEQMLFPFHRVNKNLLKAFPKLAELYQGIDPDILDDNAILYVAYMYDRGSPLQKIESLTERKIQAALMAGITPNKEGKFRPEMEAVFRCQDKAVNDMIIRYCRLISSRLYSVIVVGNETLYNTIEQLMDYVPTGTGEDLMNQTELKLKLLKQAEETAVRMDNLSREFLRDDNKNLNAYLYMVSNKLTSYINLTPEDFSKVDSNMPELKAGS